MVPLGVRALCTGCLLSQAAALFACTPFRDDPPIPPTAAVPCDPNWPFGAPKLVQGLENVGTSVGGLRLSPDYLTGYFHAMGVPGSIGLDDLYVATRRSVDSPFEQVTAMDGMDVNTKNDEQAPTVSGDGLTLVFSRAPQNPAGPGSLFVSTRETPDAPFLQASHLSVGNLVDAGETPFLVQSGAILYFALTSSGPLVLYSAGRVDGGFDAPALVASVSVDSAAFSAWYPAATPDDRILYFATNRAGSSPDDYDVWVSTRQSPDDPFSMPAPVPEVNSPLAGDFPTFVTADGCTLYLSSNRSGAYAMYVATKERPPSTDGGVEASP